MIDGIYLLLGTNLGDKKANLKIAEGHISSIVGTIEAASSVYETAAWGMEDQPSFYNKVLRVKTDLDPVEVLMRLMRIEQKMGRVRLRKWGQRVIDIDILYFENKIIDLAGLIVPHKEIANRRFTLVPLVEMIPKSTHPITNISHEEMLEQCEDQLTVELVTN